MNRTISRRARALGARLLPLAAALLAGCTSGGGAPTPRTTVSVAPAPAAAEPARVPAPLPALGVSQVRGSGTSARRIQNLEMVQQELAVVLRGLAESFGLGYEIDPSVRGTVTMRLNDVTLEQALQALVEPRGLQFQIEGNVLRVVPRRLETRIFTMDYVSLSRVGVGSSVVQRSLGSSGGGGVGMGGGAGGGIGGGGGGIGGGAGGAGGLGGGFGGSGGGITTTTVADLWLEIQVALEGLVFDAALLPPPVVDTTGVAGAADPAAAAAAAAAAAGVAAADPGLSQQQGQGAAGGAGMMRAAGPYSRTALGRRLIINPFAGIITVTASPETLADVEAYLTTIERSVQRQVLIEAKIVEVNLDREFQFGIDWSVVRSIGGVNLSFGTGQTGAQFTIDQDPDTDRMISVVLRALESQGEVSVLSSPRVSVLNNQPASFGVTTDDVFFSVTRQPILGPNGGTIGFNTQVIPQQISVGITLDVIAQISPDNVITMSIRPSITDVIAEKTVQLEDGTQASAPVIDRRDTDTMVRVRGGETVVIGGLMQTRQTERSSGVPGLRDIPGLGRLFGGVTQETEKRELVIFITPRLVAGQAPGGG